jgi:CDP-diacylglycerol--glycerol-3-phosphate 3-phosphatidyltransferase
MQPLLRMPITPNGITTIGLICALVVAWLVGAGYLLLGGLVLALSSITDIADGALARARNTATDYGAFYDSLLDRIGEAVIGLGIIVYYVNHGHAMEGSILTYLGITGALMVSYARARAEGLGLECSVGFMARPERIVVTCIGLVFAQPFGLWILTACLWILVVTTFFTTGQRLWHVYNLTHPERRMGTTSRLPRKRRIAS